MLFKNTFPVFWDKYMYYYLVNEAYRQRVKIVHGWNIKLTTLND